MASGGPEAELLYECRVAEAKGLGAVCGEQRRREVAYKCGGEVLIACDERECTHRGRASYKCGVVTC